MKKAIFFLACFVSASIVSSDEGFISICSFNIAELGGHRENKDHQAIADMIDEYDLTVVQEVMDSGGEDHIKAIVDFMNTDASETFSYFIIPKAGRGYPGNEGYAYIYRSPVVLDESYNPAFGLKETEVDYGRLPGWAFFKAGDFDFMVVGIHLHWSNLDKRTAGVADLLAWLKEFADRPESEERDLIIVGDTNRFGDYSNTKINNGETAFHQLLLDIDLDSKYRLLFCEYLTFPDAKEAPDDAGSTTVSNNNNMVYDQIMISSGAFHEFGNDRGSLGSNIGIIDFDSEMENVGTSYDDIKDQISDHRPIYAKFRYDLGDDDGLGIEPPSNIKIEDVPDDHGHRLKLTWTASPSENVEWYRIFRSRSDSLTIPIPLSQFTSIDSLISCDEHYTILIDSVTVDFTEYIDSVPLNGVTYYYWLQASGSSGVSKKVAAEIITTVNEILKQQSIKLYGNFPNPFNPETTIKYSLLHDTHVELIIYNVSGQVVSAIKNEYSKVGNYSVTWNAGDMPSGLYFCTLKTSNFKVTKKMLLLR
ncbi:T9SS type A sorting domain-containing protein [Candidatus Omnitrophota bacterium]